MESPRLAIALREDSSLFGETIIRTLIRDHSLLSMRMAQNGEDRCRLDALEWWRSPRSATPPLVVVSAPRHDRMQLARIRSAYV
jgi:hypothetical protein